MPQPLNNVNMFGPIGGTDYLKLHAAAKFRNRLKGNPIMRTTTSPTNQLQPAAVQKNAGVLHLERQQYEGLPRVARHGTAEFPYRVFADPVLKAAAEKLIYGCTSMDTGRDKTAYLQFLPTILSAGSLAARAVPAAWRIGRGAYGLARGGLGALRGGTGAAQAFRQADNIGSGVSGAFSAASAAAKGGAKAYSPASSEAYRTLARIGEEAGKLKGTGLGNRVWQGLYGSGLGYGVDAGAGMAGIDTGGWGATIGGAGGLVGGGPLRTLRRGLLGRHGEGSYRIIRGKPQYTLGQQVVRTGDNIANSLRDFGKQHAGKLHTAAGLGGVGMVQSATTGGLYDMTDLQGNIRRGQEFGINNAAKSLGYEDYHDAVRDVSPVIRDVRELLTSPAYAQRR